MEIFELILFGISLSLLSMVYVFEMENYRAVVYIVLMVWVFIVGMWVMDTGE